jgi:hypothetical protein
MRTFLVSYDLAKPNRNKHVLAQEIMGLGERWARPLENTWYVEGRVSAAEVERRLSGLLDTDDGLLIQQVENQALLANTSLRWFRQRRTMIDITPDSNVIAFPAPPAAEPIEPELPFARAS